MGSEQQGIAMGKKEVATSRVFWRSSGSRSTSAEGRNGEENSEMGAAERRCGHDEEDAGGRRRWEKRDTVRFDVNGVGGMENIRKIYICCLNY